MAKLTHRTRCFVAAALVVILGQGKARGDSDGTSVAVIALPSAETSQTSRATHELAQAFISALQAAGFRVVIAGTPAAVPLEELTAVANGAAVDLAIGVRSLRDSQACPGLHTPHAVSRPAQLKSAGSQAQLAADVKQLTTAIRYEASLRLARSLEAVGHWCHPKATQPDAYVLAGIAAPTVVLSLPVPSGEA